MNTRNYSNQLNNFSRKITVLVCIASESSGSSSESDDYSDSNRSDVAASLSSFYLRVSTNIL